MEINAGTWPIDFVRVATRDNVERCSGAMKAQWSAEDVISILPRDSWEACDFRRAKRGLNNLLLKMMDGSSRIRMGLSESLPFCEELIVSALMCAAGRYYDGSFFVSQVLHI